MNKIDFKQILELYPDIRSYFSSIEIGDVSGLDIINFELGADTLHSSLRENAVAEARDLLAHVRASLTVNDVQYRSMKEFAENFAIPNGEKMEFPFNCDEVLNKIKDCSIIGLIAEKVFDNNCETVRKMSRQVFDRSSYKIIERIGSNGLSLEQVKGDFEAMAVEYTNKSSSFTIPKMVELFSQYKNQEKELDITLIDMVLPV